MDSDRVVAVIGAGPAGLYAAKQLAAQGCQVVVFNRDIKPGGLAEYGIYVEKHRLKEGFRAQFRMILSTPEIHYLGNVMVGRVGDLSLDQIRGMGFHAVLVTVGAQAEKKLGLPGESLNGVYNAKDLVYHYNHLPPYSEMIIPIGRKVFIVGAGNVMMDITHWLIDKCRVSDVTAVVRRGPAEVKFDRKELESIISNLDMDGLRSEIARVSDNMLSLGQDPSKIMATYQEATVKAFPHESKTRVSIHFLASPHQILGDEHGNVSGLEIEETTLVCENDQVKAAGTGKYQVLAADTVIFAIGDLIDNRLGLPVVSNQFARNPRPLFPIEGQSYEAFEPDTGQNISGIFMAGWARLASTGVVGIAKKDGTNAALAIKQYLDSIPDRPRLNVDILLKKILDQLANPVTNSDIRKLEETEKQIACQQGLEEFKFNTNSEMLEIIKK